MHNIEHIKNITGRCQSLFRCDNAAEYLSKQGQNYHLQRGIDLTPSTAYTPQENSIAEGINQTLMRHARAVLQHSRLDYSFWADALRDAAFKYNLMYHTGVGNLPHTLWHRRPPVISQILAFGQLGSIPSLIPIKKKLQTRAEPVRYMHGIDENHIRIYNLRNHKYQIARTVNFSPYAHRLDPCRHSTITFHTATPTVHQLSEQKRSPREKPSSQRNVPVTITTNTPPPRSTAQARKYPDANFWQVAHDSELVSIGQCASFEDFASYEAFFRRCFWRKEGEPKPIVAAKQKQ